MPDYTEEKLKEITIGERKPHNSTIYLSEYDPQWPELFEVEKKRIQSALGDHALQIEHVGSTSIPDLIAKPIIDILLVVEDSTNESSYVSHLESSGYILRVREPDWFQHRLFKGLNPPLNLHVFSKGCSEIDKMLLFRDYLRNNPQAKELYANTKRKLAKKTWKYVQDYANAKSAVVEGIVREARDFTNQ